MRRALQLAGRGRGRTSPNPCVGAVIVRGDTVLGEGWHKRAGTAHAEVAALDEAKKRRARVKGATLYVTLEPCSTTGRTPPCTGAIIAAGIRRVVIGALDPNPDHAGRAPGLLKRHGIKVDTGVLADRCCDLNESFNHWIVHRRPFVVLKAAMTLDGKIATKAGESKWITGPEAGRQAMRLRQESDAILVGSNTILADDPSLTCRAYRDATKVSKHIRRIVLDTHARTPLSAKVVADECAADTVIVIGKDASKKRVERLQRRVEVWSAPLRNQRIDLKWLLRRLGREPITNVLVEGGGEVNGSFIDAGLVNRVAFFYAPKILGGFTSKRGVAGKGFEKLAQLPRVKDGRWRQLGDDLYFTGLVDR